MRTILLTTLLFFSLITFSQIPQTGFYDTMILHRDEKNKSVNGYFYACINEGHICCIYSFTGKYNKITDSKIEVLAFWHDDTEKIRGTLYCKDESNFRLKFDSNLPGYMACMDIPPGEGTILSLSEKKNWIGIKVVKSAKAYFHKEPNISTKRKSYIIKSDGVGVLEQQGEWLKVEFIGISEITGWVKRAEFY